MDFSRFKTAIEGQQQAFNGIKDTLNAKAFDDICSVLNNTLNDIALVASVVPVNSKQELIDILKSLRNLAMDLVEYKKKFDSVKVEEKPEPTFVMLDRKNEQKVESTPVEPVIEETVPEATGNNINQNESQTLQQENHKSLELTPPNVPKGVNPFVMPTAA